jgi:adenylate cyclase, class 2
MSEKLYMENKENYICIKNNNDYDTLCYNPEIETQLQMGGASKNKNKEIEFRFDNIDTISLRKRLKKLGGKLVQKKLLMPLIVFNHPTGNKDSYIRIRHEGNKITMTSKTDLKDKFVTEYEVVIDSFQQGVLLLMSLGCTKRYYVEKLRETWNFMNTEVVIDSYPGTVEFIEVEAKDEKDLTNVMKILDLPKPSGNIDMYYEQYGVPKDRKLSGDLTIDNVKEKFGKMITKNKTQFNKIVKEQKVFYKGSEAQIIKNILKKIDNNT